MVPAHPRFDVRCLRTGAVAPTETPAPHAHHDAADRRQRAQRGQHDHHPRPHRIHRLHAQEVQPVQPGAHIVPALLHMRCVQHHFTGTRGHIQVARLCTAHLDAIQRPMHIQRARMRPAVLVHARRTHERLAAGELCSGCFGALCRHRQQRLAGVRRPGTHVAAIAHHIRRLATQRGQCHAFRLGLHSGRQYRQPLQIADPTQLRQCRQPLTGRQLRVADEQHHHAADEPQQHQQASADAQPAVHQVGPALGSGSQRHGARPQKRWSTVNSTRRSAPSSHCVLV